MTQKPAILMQDIEHSWPGNGSFVLTVRRFVLEKGERVLLLGPSGGGKSTFLSLIAGITGPKRGDISVLGTTLGKLSMRSRDRFRAEHLGIIFQMFNLLPYGSALDNVILPLSFAPGRQAKAERAGGIRTEALRLMHDLGLPQSVQSQPAATLSVGQQQRVAAARALIGSPEIVIADEPTSALDEDRRKDFLDTLFAQVAAASASLLMVSHDRRIADHFDRVVSLPDLIGRESVGA